MSYMEYDVPNRTVIRLTTDGGVTVDKSHYRWPGGMAQWSVALGWTALLARMTSCNESKLPATSSYRKLT